MSAKAEALKLARRRKRLQLGALGVLVLGALLAGHVWLAALLVLLAWLLNELLWADHIFYPLAADQHHAFTEGKTVAATLRDGRLVLGEALPAELDTLVLSLRLRATLSGRWRDPWVSLRDAAGRELSRQYLERGAAGLRHLNLSAALASLRQGEALHLLTGGCQLQPAGLCLQGFANPDYRARRTLILAPHADDAELAAFGVYRHAREVYIATVSAGEIEAEPFEMMAGPGESAARLKGRLRAWDSISVPLWAGVPAERCVQLGYFCMTLPALRLQRDRTLPSRAGAGLRVDEFRSFNHMRLPSDGTAENRWPQLVSDLQHLLRSWQPEVIVLPHPVLDAHPDHRACAQAMAEALAAEGQAPSLLLYANHLAQTEMYPFGPEHADLALPPWFEALPLGHRLWAMPLEADTQRDKVCALKMMHDLNRPERFKRRLRRTLQAVLLGRSRMPYGADDYYRRAVRQHELFWVSDSEQLARWCAADDGKY